MDSTQSFQIFNRGPSPAARFVFFAVLSLLLMFIDARYRYLDSTRGLLSMMAAPVQELATQPGKMWRRTLDFFVTQTGLVEQNHALKQRHDYDAAELSQMRALQQENQQLRKLLELPQRTEYAAVPAEIVYAERDVFKRKLLIDKGANAHVALGQVVIDDAGIVGQVTRVFPLLSEVTLITEKDQAVPVQVVRNGLRTIVFGAGDISQLSLRYMPISSDIQEGDVLVTSGIDGVYPQGLPVAKITRIERDPAYPFARVNCLPLAGVDSNRHLLVLTGQPVLPERPPEEVAPPEAAEKTPGKRGGR